MNHASRYYKPTNTVSNPPKKRELSHPAILLLVTFGSPLIIRRIKGQFIIRFSTSRICYQTYSLQGIAGSYNCYLLLSSLLTLNRKDVEDYKTKSRCERLLGSGNQNLQLPFYNQKVFGDYMQRLIPVASSMKHFSSTTKNMTVRDALNSALDEEMAADSNVFIMGEEVGEYQGAYKITKGLLDKYGPDRVVDTPITEVTSTVLLSFPSISYLLHFQLKQNSYPYIQAGFTGIGVGAAYHGLKPVIEFMTFNFSMQAIDHIINSAAKSNYMSAGQINVPIVFRGPNGAAAGVGAQHSQCFGAWFGAIPGLKVLVPYSSEDARGLLKAAIRDPDPVVFLENEILYGESFPVSPEVLDPNFCLPIGKAKIEREGKDVTITAYSKMVSFALKAAEILEKDGINAEVINLRCIRPLDRDTINKSVRKTNRLVTVEEGFRQHGVGAEICATVVEDSFGYLDAPVERIAGADVPTPYAPNLERLAFPQIEDIVRATKRACYRSA
ncbi:hypothetical protein LXL04_025727 [Taraxacum kok-saghyz]